MKQHKRKCILLFILTFLFSCYAVTAAATEITPEQVENIINQQSSDTVKSSSNFKPKEPSSPPSSKPEPSSSKKAKRSSSRSYTKNSVSKTSGAVLSTMSEIVLPSVASVEEENPLNSLIVDKTAEKKMNWIGIFSWACIILGVVVVLLVVFSNRRPPRGGSGRKRYHKPKRSKKKRLLNDKYYRNFRY